MVDKIGWTEPLCSERDALEFLAKGGGRRTRWRAVVGGWRGRLSIVEPDTGPPALAPPQPLGRSCDQPLLTVNEKCRQSHYTNHRVSGLVQRDVASLM